MMLIKDNNAAGRIDRKALEEIEFLLYQETELLDTGDYDRWLALYTEDCLYWVPAQMDQDDPLDHISLYYEDRTLMKMRIERLRHPQAHSLTDPIRSSHVTSHQAIEALDAESGLISVSARFTMTEYYRNEQRVFSGKYTYELREVAGNYRIRSKRVDLINCDAILEPIQVFL